MLLSLTALDAHGQWRQFACWLTSLEFSFDVLNRLVASGNTLIEVTLTDDRQHSINLPPQAFDGSCYSDPIQQLEREWQTILSWPTEPAAN